MDLVTMIMACSLYRDNSIINAMVELSSKNKPLQVVTALDGATKTTTRVASAAAGEVYVNNQLTQGHDVYIGLMQIPSGWLNKYRAKASVAELFRPCKNMVIATTILNHATELCAKHFDRDPRCALSIYYTGTESPVGQAYADTILAYAKTHPVPATPQYEKALQATDQAIGLTPAEVELPQPQFVFDED